MRRAKGGVGGWEGGLKGGGWRAEIDREGHRERKKARNRVGEWRRERKVGE